MPDTLREYLIQLGFRVDDTTWRKYVGAVSTAGKTTAELGSAAVEAATAIEVAVAGIARQYQSLYYLGQSTGKSIGVIQSYQYGMKQIGVSADDAAGAIESMAETARTLPGVGGMFGGATDPEAVVEQLQHAHVMYAVAKQMAALRGVPGGVFERLWLLTPEDRTRQKKSQDDFTRWLHEAGVDSKDFGNRVVEVNSALNDLEGHLEVAGQRFFTDFSHPVAVGLGYVGKATEYVTKADRATNGWLVTLTSLAATFGGSTFLTSLLLKPFGINVSSTMRGGFGLMLRGIPLAIAGVLAYEIGKEVLEQDKSGTVLSDEVKKRLDGQPQWKRWAVELPTIIGNWIGENIFGVDPSVTHPSLPGAPGPGKPLDLTPAARRRRGRPEVHAMARGVEDRMSQGMQMLVDAGYSPEAAEGIMSGLYYESDRTLDNRAFNPAGGGRGARGVPQLRGERLDEFRSKFGKDISEADFREAMEYVIWALAGKGKDVGAGRAGADLKTPGVRAGESAKIFLREFERPGPAGEREVADAADLAERLSRRRLAEGGSPVAAPIAGEREVVDAADLAERLTRHRLAETPAPAAPPIVYAPPIAPRGGESLDRLTLDAIQQSVAGARLGTEGGDVVTYNFNNKAEINVTGPDGAETAEVVLGAQGRVNDDFAALVRNTGSPHR